MSTRRKRSSSRRWLDEHFQDEYVKRAQREGFRSRAVYKLDEINRKYGLIKPGSIVVDLGAAPGSWSQYCVSRVRPDGQVVALDRLAMQPLSGVTWLQGDFREQAMLDELLAVLAGHPVDLVLSDMAPNTSGIKAVDHPQAMDLAELAVDFAQRCLRPGGDVLVKVFQGEGFDKLLKTLRADFGKVCVCKPSASRARSPELYLLARNYAHR